MNIENKLDTIIEKYKLSEKVYFRDRLSEIIKMELRAEISKYGNKIVIRGINNHEDGEYALCKLVDEIGNVKAVVDQFPFSDKLCITSDKEVPFFSSSWLPSKEECDIYLINAFSKGRNIYYEMKEKLEARRGIHVIDLYRIIRIKYSIIVDRPYDDYRNEYDYTHHLLGNVRKDFLTDKTLENLKKMLGMSLILRDFVSFFKYMDEETDLIEDKKEFQEMRGEVESLLIEIKDKLILRKQKFDKKDIIIHWIDQVSFEEGDLFPKLRNRMRSGLNFLNAYTHTPYTLPTARMIFYKEFWKRESVVGKCEDRVIEDSALYQNIESEEYKFEIFGNLKQVLYNDYSQEYNAENVVTTIHYFRLLNFILNSESPIVGMIHISCETHEPYMSPEVDWENRAFEYYDSYISAQKKIVASALYIDEVMGFYDDLYGSGTINIYMSDHGKWEDVDRRRFKDEAMHTLLGVTNAGICGSVNRLFSYQDFDKLIKWVLEMAKSEEMFFNDVPIYSEGLKAVINERVQENEEICAGYCGLNSPDDKYVCLDNGTEYYYKKTYGESQNNIDDKDYKERVEYLRHRCNELKKAFLGDSIK